MARAKKTYDATPRTVLVVLYVLSEMSDTYKGNRIAIILKMIRT